MYYLLDKGFKTTLFNVLKELNKKYGLGTIGNQEKILTKSDYQQKNRNGKN